MEETPLPKMALSLDETATVLGVSRSTVGRLIKQGKLRVSVLGHRTRLVTPAAIDDLLRDHEMQGSPGEPVKRFVPRDGAGREAESA